MAAWKATSAKDEEQQLHYILHCIASLADLHHNSPATVIEEPYICHCEHCRHTESCNLGQVARSWRCQRCGSWWTSTCSDMSSSTTRESVSWSPLNSHLPLNEGIGEALNLSEWQLDLLAEDRHARKKEHIKAAYYRERAKDVDAYLSKKRKEKAAWAARNAQKVAAQHAKIVAKIKADRRFACSPCDIALASSRALKKHLASDAHKAQLELLAGAEETAPSLNTLRVRKHAANARAEKRLYCSVCDHSATGPVRLAIHKKTKRHLKKVAKLGA